MTAANPSGSTLDTAFDLRIVASAEPAREGHAIAVSMPIVIGRDAACDVVLHDPSVSRRHARVEPAASGLRVLDLGSGNGVLVGAVRVSDVVVEVGQRFQIGSTVFECRAVEVTATAPAGEAGTGTGARLHVRLVEGGIEEEAGQLFERDGPSIVIGRAKDCAIVLRESDLSRRHARLDVEGDRVRLTDLGSTCGTFVDGQRVSTVVLGPDQTFRLGDRLLLQASVLGAGEAASEPVPVDPDATVFVRRPMPASAPVSATGAGAAHAPAPAAPASATTGGTRSAVAAAAAESLAEAAKMAESEDFGGTVVMPIPAELVAATWRIEEEGEAVAASAHSPFLLDDPTVAYYVVSGGLLIFTVALEKGEPAGTRAHFLGIVPGQVCLGIDIRKYGVASGFLAVPKPGTTLRRIPLTRVQQLAADPARRAVVAGLIDTWIAGLSAALVASAPSKRTEEIPLAPGALASLDQTQKATSAGGVLWVRIWSGSVLYDDLSTPRFTRRDALFPLTPQSWIRPVSDEFGPLTIRPLPTRDVMAEAEIWDGLDVFHQVLCESEFVSKKLALADEYVRLRQKAQHAEGAQQAAYDVIGSVLSSEGATPEEFRAPGDAEPTLRACQLVGQALGIPVKPHPAAEEGLTYEERVSSIATASGFRTRVVALRDNWHQEDNGPLLGQVADTKEPVALLPDGPGRYLFVDPRTGSREPVDEAKAATLSGFAYTFYRPFPDTLLRVSDVVKWGARGTRGDLLWVFVMAIVVGVLGTVTPFITGQVFDAAIPQAERNALVGLGVALVMSAAAGAVFKFVQGVATLRIQTRMSSTIQAAVWDRIMNLPTSFFRQFSAGDLADRAQGVDAIQRLVSGAGVAAILGSVSGLFYVVQMFGFNLRLALLAVLLTFIFVAVNMTANYLQLRYQRLELRLRGRISGLVLNLLTGVTKLRICGAEHHAFRVWAEQFAEQRRIGFTVGTIQNLATTFASVYPIISSIAIFAVMIGIEQGAAAGEGLSTGEFIAFNAAYGLFLMAMQALGDASLSLLRVVPIYERLSPILTTAPEVDATKAFPGVLTGRIELSHVSFRYTSDGPWIINDVSLTIEPGEFVAFVGSSGGGKSTLFRLMLGFETPTRGTVLYDGQDLNALDMRMVRQQLGVVLQQSRVMPTEIFRNIVGVTSRTIDDAWEAAEKAGLAEDIRNMPMGMHTYVSEGGGTLSGGQRQRLMIARAIVNKPKILFLDEATSALDNRAQAIVTESMDRMDATRIVIAHRLSTVINANRICYLHGGRIAEIGTYQELMEKDGLFAALAKRQTA